MKRLILVGSLSFGLLAANFALAGHGHGGSGGGGGGAARMSSSHSHSMGSAMKSAPITRMPSGGIKTSPVTKTGPIISKPPKNPTGPFVPPKNNGPIVGPVKPPKNQTGPIVPPKNGSGPIVGPIGPVKPPKNPNGPIIPPKHPGGPIVGPIGPVKPPHGPIKPPGSGPIGPVKPPKGPGSGNPSGPIVPPCYPHHWCGVGGFPWYGYGFGLGLPYGGYGYGGCYSGGQVVVQQQPVVIEVPVQAPPAEAPAAAPSEAPAEAPAAAPTATPAAAPVEQAIAQKLQQVRVGTLLEIPGKDFGKEQGGVMLIVGDLALGCLVSDWKSDKIQATLPVAGLAGPKPAELVVVTPDGKVAVSVRVELLPAEQKEEVVVTQNQP